jgi:hypothetical protein
MIFVRAELSLPKKRIVRVFAQDKPFIIETLSSDPSRKTICLGVCAWREWKDLDGNPAAPAQDIFQRIQALGGINAKRREYGHLVQALGHVECPTTMNGVRFQLRRAGPASLPVRVRAWLTLSLEDSELRGLGPIWADIPWSVLALLERQRVKQNPHAGSRIEVIERAIQEQSDRRSEVALSRRQLAEAADSAWQEMSALANAPEDGIESVDA